MGLSVRATTAAMRGPAFQTQRSDRPRGRRAQVRWHADGRILEVADRSDGVAADAPAAGAGFLADPPLLFDGTVCNSLGSAWGVLPTGALRGILTSIGPPPPRVRRGSHLASRTGAGVAVPASLFVPALGDRYPPRAGVTVAPSHAICSAALLAEVAEFARARGRVTVRRNTGKAVCVEADEVRPDRSLLCYTL